MQRRDWLTGMALAGAGAMWGTLSWAQSASTAAAESKAPPLPPLGAAWSVPAMARLDGSRFEPRDADGQVLVLYWWASTCPFCAATSPHLERFWRTHASRPGWMLLGLSIDKTPELAQRYLQQRGYTFPSAWVTPEVQRAMPKPKGLPVTLIRGRDGRLLLAERGQLFPEDIDGFARWL